MDRENVIKENDLYTTEYKSSSDLTQMIQWKGINYNDFLYSPVFGEVTLVNIGASEPTISVRDTRGNLHRFDSQGRLNGNGEVMLFPDKNKKWESVLVYTYHKIPSRAMLLEKDFKAIEEICDIIYRLKIAAKYIDDLFDLCFDDNSDFIRYVYCVKIENEEKEDEEIKTQPLSFGRKSRIGVREIDKRNYIPEFLRSNRIITAERDFFEFKSVSAASYFFKLYKEDLVILYSGLLNIMKHILYHGIVDQTVEIFKTDPNVESTLNNEMMICKQSGSSSRQKDLSEKELFLNYYSKDLTKMINWMNIKKGQSLYSSAFGYLELLSTEKEEPRIKAIDASKIIYNFTSEGKYYEGGEVILFPEKGKKWLPIKKPFKQPTKEDIEKIVDKDLTTTCNLLYRLMVSAQFLDEFFERILSNRAISQSTQLCTIIVRKEGTKNVATYRWIASRGVFLDYDVLECFYLFTFKSYSALYYFIQLFKSDLEFIYFNLFNVKISEWDERWWLNMR